MGYFSIFIIGFALTCVGLAIFYPLARRLKLVDHPGGRKVHDKQTPLVGGLAIFSALIVSLAITHGSLQDYIPLLSACGLMVFVGVLDDIYDLPPWLRFLPQIIVGLIMVYWSGSQLYNLGDLLPSGMLGLSWAAVPFTIVGMVGVINAINMMDGLDGLAGLVSLPALVALAWAAGETAPGAATVLWTVAGCLLAFLCFNLRIFGRKHALVFLGDSGSMLLGLVLAWYVIELSQPPTSLLPPVSALWLLILPLFDTVGIMLGRIRRGKSPFEADQKHLHHRILNRGYSVTNTVLIMGAVAAACAAVGIGTYLVGVPDWLMFVLFIGLFAVYYWKIHHARD